MAPQTNDGGADRQPKGNDQNDQRKKLREKNRPIQTELVGKVCGFGKRDVVHGRGCGVTAFWERRVEPLKNPSSAIAAAPAQARFLSHRLRACHCSRRSGPRCSWSASLPVKSSELCRTSGEAMQSSSVENGQPQSNARTKNSSGRRCATRCSPASLDPSSTRWSTAPATP